MSAKRTDVEHWNSVLRAVPPNVIEVACDNWFASNRTSIAEEWGFPLVGKTIDVLAVLKRLREFLLHYAPLLRVLKEDGEEGPLGVQYLRAKIEKTEQDAHGKSVLNAQKEGRLCDREQVHGVFEVIASHFVRAADAAQKKWGQDGFEFFTDLATKLEDAFGGLLDEKFAADEAEDLDTDDDDPPDVRD